MQAAPALRIEPQQAPALPRDSTFESWAREGLVWLPEHGMGCFPVREAPYDADYFAKYQRYADTEMGRALTAHRVALVEVFHDADLIDVGIGCGDFIQERGAPTYGYDVNPRGIEWLKERKLWRDPYAGPAEAISLWDVLEHIPEPAALLKNVQKWVFTCLPVFRNGEHVVISKHFRRDEHCWYWTAEGFKRWMRSQGFECVLQDDTEIRLGREDILSFVFRRAA